jgi:hypothetical protein
MEPDHARSVPGSIPPRSVVWVGPGRGNGIIRSQCLWSVRVVVSVSHDRRHGWLSHFPFTRPASSWPRSCGSLPWGRDRTDRGRARIVADRAAPTPRRPGACLGLLEVLDDGDDAVQDQFGGSLYSSHRLPPMSDPVDAQRFGSMSLVRLRCQSGARFGGDKHAGTAGEQRGAAQAGAFGDVVDAGEKTLIQADIDS